MAIFTIDQEIEYLKEKLILLQQAKELYPDLCVDKFAAFTMYKADLTQDIINGTLESDINHQSDGGWLSLFKTLNFNQSSIVIINTKCIRIQLYDLGSFRHLKYMTILNYRKKLDEINLHPNVIQHINEKILNYLKLNDYWLKFKENLTIDNPDIKTLLAFE